MKRLYWLSVVLIAVVLVFGCATTAKAPMAANGGKIEIFLLSNRGDPNTMTERQFKYRNEVGKWMERDLINILNKTGYEARLIQSKDEYTPGQGKYLLSVTIVSYHLVNRAARFWSAFSGAGPTTLNTHYKLFGESSKPLLAYDDGVGSSEEAVHLKDWKICARELNQNAARRVTEKLTQLQ